MPAFGDMIDPFDEQALRVFEDVLDLKCYCRITASDTCPVHNGRGIGEALRKFTENHEAEIEAAREAGAESRDEDVKEAADERDEAKTEADKAETRSTKLCGAVQDLIAAVERAVPHEERSPELAQAIKDADKVANE